MLTNKFGAIVLGILLGISPVANADKPLDWLSRMQQALHLLDYEGRFVYQAGPRIESLYIVHRVHDQHELERLVALNGEPREIIRGHASVAFIKPGQYPINVDETSSRDNRQQDYAQLAAHYRIQLAGQDRVAGRTAQIVEILPKDHLRYGHRLYLDQATALPLQSVLLDAQGRILSQNLFVELKVGKDITPIERDISALSLTQPEPTEPGRTRAKPSGWFFTALPAGYAQTGYRYQPERQREHFVFSDGLSSISLYIEQPGHQDMQGHSSMGPTQTLALQKHAHQVMLVGEAPMAALDQLAKALQRND